MWAWASRTRNKVAKLNSRASRDPDLCRLTIWNETKICLTLFRGSKNRPQKASFYEMESLFMADRIRQTNKMKGCMKISRVTTSNTKCTCLCLTRVRMLRNAAKIDLIYRGMGIWISPTTKGCLTTKILRTQSIFRAAIVAVEETLAKKKSNWRKRLDRKMRRLICLRAATKEWSKRESTSKTLTSWWNRRQLRQTFCHLWSVTTKMCSIWPRQAPTLTQMVWL